MKTTLRTLAICFAIAGILLSGCTSLSKSANKEIPPKPTLSIAEFGIVSDVGLKKHSTVGKDYYLIAESRGTAITMMRACKAHLELRGYRIKYEFNPFVGGYLPSHKKYKVAARDKAKKSRTRPPLATEFAPADSATANAYQQVLTQARTIPYLKAANINELGDYKEDLRRIREHSGMDHILFLTSYGYYIPSEVATREMCLTFCVSLVLTMGTMWVAYKDESNISAKFVLLDLNSGEIMWKHTSVITGDGSTDDDFIRNTWADQALFTFPAMAK